MNLLPFIEDGRRAYRLKYSINRCPAFDEEIYRRAWKLGYYSARDGVSVSALRIDNKRIN